MLHPRNGFLCNIGQILVALPYGFFANTRKNSFATIDIARLRRGHRASPVSPRPIEQALGRATSKDVKSAGRFREFPFPNSEPDLSSASGRGPVLASGDEPVGAGPAALPRPRPRFPALPASREAVSGAPVEAPHSLPPAPSPVDLPRPSRPRRLAGRLAYGFRSLEKGLSCGVNTGLCRSRSWLVRSPPPLQKRPTKISGRWGKGYPRPVYYPNLNGPNIG